MFEETRWDVARGEEQVERAQREDPEVDHVGEDVAEHCIVKNIFSLRTLNIAHAYLMLITWEVILRSLNLTSSVVLKRSASPTLESLDVNNFLCTENNYNQ